MKRCCKQAISELLKCELTAHLGREKYERHSVYSDQKLPACEKEDGQNYRNGSYHRKFTAKGIGEMNIEVPRDRNGTFNSRLIDKYRRYEKSLESDIVLMFLSGLSTRNLSLISHRLLGRKISASEVSNAGKEMLTGIDAWRLRPLGEFKIKYMFMDRQSFLRHLKLSSVFSVY